LRFYGLETFPAGINRAKASAADRTLKGLPHTLRKCLVGERLLQDTQRLATDAVVANGTIGVAGPIDRDLQFKAAEVVPIDDLYLCKPNFAIKNIGA